MEKLFDGKDGCGKHLATSEETDSRRAEREQKSTALETCWFILEVLAQRPAHFEDLAILQVLRPVKVITQGSVYRRKCTPKNGLKDETEVFTRGEASEWEEVEGYLSIFLYE